MGVVTERLEGRTDPFQKVALVLFLCTGLALPFYAFPVFRAAGRSIDLATVFAGLFLVASLLNFRPRGASRAIGILASASVAVALLVLIEPRPPLFKPTRFAASFGHWVMVVSFFFGASLLRLTSRSRRRIVLAIGLMGAAVAAFGLYQVIGHRAGWPGTGTLLLPFQREPLRLMPIGNLGYLRPTSVFLEPAWLGGYLAFVLAGLFGLLAAGGSKLRVGRAAAVAALAVILLAILSTVSWGAYLDLASVLVVSIWTLRERLRARPAAAVAVACAVLAAILAIGVSPIGRVVANAATERWRMLLGTPVGEDVPAEDVSDSSWMRSENVRHTVELIREYPWRGVGIGQFGLYARTSGPSFISTASTRAPWCGWLAIAAEAGLLGPVVLAGFLLAVLARRSAGRRSAGNVSDDAFRGVIAPALVLLAFVQQAHTGSYIDLWWWYPLSVALVLASPSTDASPPAILPSGN